MDDSAPNSAEAPQAQSVESDTGLLSLVTIARFFRVALSPDQVRHELGLVSGRLLTDDLLRAARRHGFKAKRVETSWARLTRLALPAIGEAKDGTFFVLAAVNERAVLIKEPLDPAPKEVAREVFEERWTGALLLVTTRSAVSGAERRFDLTWFIPSLVRYRHLFGEVLIASFFLQLLALASPLLFQLVIDKVLVHHSLTTLDVLVFALAATSLFEVLLGFLRTYVFTHTSSRVDVELGARLFQHLLGLPIAYFEARQTGQSVARVRELENVRSFMTGSALTLVLDLFFTFVFLLVMFLYSVKLTLIVIASIPAYVALSVIVTPIFRTRLNEKFDRGSENQTFLVESIVGIETLKAMAVEPQMQRRWEDQLSGYVKASFRAAQLGNIASQIAQLINKAVVIITLWIGARLVMEGHLTVGQLVAFNMLAGRVSGPVLRLAQLWQDFQQFRISIARLGDILNAPSETNAAAARSAMAQIRGLITFDHVTFRYRPGGSEILSDVSIEIPPGQVLGVVGPSGSGKSTLAKLVQRLYVPESGRVLVDGQDLALVDPSWLRRQIGVVLQENMLFARSVRDNIALADPGMPFERIVHAAQLAGAHDFILTLPHAYDTILEERGGNLSGGQRQRLAIARALITNPRILILDEATSALDFESEHIIQNNMRMIARGRTVIIVAHRLAAVRFADRIITIENGRIVEDGSHSDLIGRNGRYASFYRHQVGAVAQPAE